jgi:DNA-binding LytR/AlgR family response regulator
LCCQYISSEKEYHAYLGEIFILLSARDTFFLVLFFLFKIYRNVEESLIIKQKIFANEMKQIVVSISANEEIILAIKNITYIESQKNKTFIHLINGKIYSQYSSLVDMEEILPNELRLRINRSTIIMFKYIISFTERIGLY